MSSLYLGRIEIHAPARGVRGMIANVIDQSYQDNRGELRVNYRREPSEPSNPIGSPTSLYASFMTPGAEVIVRCRSMPIGNATPFGQYLTFNGEILSISYDGYFVEARIAIRMESYVIGDTGVIGPTVGMLSNRASDTDIIGPTGVQGAVDIIGLTGVIGVIGNTGAPGVYDRPRRITSTFDLNEVVGTDNRSSDLQSYDDKAREKPRPPEDDNRKLDL